MFQVEVAVRAKAQNHDVVGIARQLWGTGEEVRWDGSVTLIREEI